MNIQLLRRVKTLLLHKRKTYELMNMVLARSRMPQIVGGAKEINKRSFIFFSGMGVCIQRNGGMIMSNERFYSPVVVG